MLEKRWRKLTFARPPFRLRNAGCKSNWFTGTYTAAAAMLEPEAEDVLPCSDASPEVPSTDVVHVRPRRGYRVGPTVNWACFVRQIKRIAYMRRKWHWLGKWLSVIRKGGRLEDDD